MPPEANVNVHNVLQQAAVAAAARLADTNKSENDEGGAVEDYPDDDVVCTALICAGMWQRL